MTHGLLEMIMVNYTLSQNAFDPWTLVNDYFQPFKSYKSMNAL